MSEKVDEKNVLSAKEAAALMWSPNIPREQRLLYGVALRGGMRRSDATRIEWPSESES